MSKPTMEERIVELEASIIKLRPTWRNLRREFKTMDGQMGDLYCELMDLKRMKHEVSPGITKLAPYAPGKPKVKKLSYDQVVANLKNMTQKQIRELMSELKED